MGFSVVCSLLVLAFSARFVVATRRTRRDPKYHATDIMDQTEIVAAQQRLQLIEAHAADSSAMGCVPLRQVLALGKLK